MSFFKPTQFLAALAFLNFLVLLPSAACAETLAIKAGKLVNTQTGSVEKDQVIIVEDGVFKAVGNNITVPKNARLIDLSSKTILPGLIDCHTHLTDETSLDPIIELQKTAAQKAFESIPYARRTVEAGFTSVRDVGTSQSTRRSGITRCHRTW